MHRLGLIRSHIAKQQAPQHSIYQCRHALVQCLQPQLTDIIRRHIKKEYRKILPKVEEARSEVKMTIKTLNLLKEPQQIKETDWKKYKTLLAEKLHETMSEMVNDIADRLAENLTELPDSNPIVKGIRVFSSVIGSYQNRLTLFQLIIPNMRTLTYLQNEIMHYSGDNREFSSSIWVLLYIFSFAFVQMFGKYITRPEKEAVLTVLRETFVSKLLSVIDSLIEEGTTQEQLGKWMTEIMIKTV